jgi:hypothetical protein
MVTTLLLSILIRTHAQRTGLLLVRMAAGCGYALVNRCGTLEPRGAVLGKSGTSKQNTTTRQRFIRLDGALNAVRGLFRSSSFGPWLAMVPCRSPGGTTCPYLDRGSKQC